jgi:NAD(P)-dependent dehydrogenase (short-subunit alcohol dehydrogenase family)
MTSAPFAGMHSLREGYRALVIGASGALGRAFVQALERDPRCGEVQAVSRGQPCDWDLTDAPSLTALAAQLSGPWHLVVDATGALSLDGHGPEKRLQELDGERLLHSLQLNAVGPALLLQQLCPQLARGERVIWAKLSARVGSIEDNRKGGWYGYRAAKAALNQLLQTAAIELVRQRSLAVVAALQPGTVRSALSRPFVGDDALDPALSAQRLLAVLNALEPNGRAQFVDHLGQHIPW